MCEASLLLPDRSIARSCPLHDSSNTGRGPSNNPYKVRNTGCGPKPRLWAKSVCNYLCKTTQSFCFSNLDTITLVKTNTQLWKQYLKAESFSSSQISEALARKFNFAVLMQNGWSDIRGENSPLKFVATTVAIFATGT